MRAVSVTVRAMGRESVAAGRAFGRDDVPIEPDKNFLAEFDLLSGEYSEVVPTVISVPAHPDAAELLAYWHACEERGGMRLGRDIPARAIARLMSKLSVLEPVGEQRDFRFRLAGSGWLRRFGRDITGQLLSELYTGASLDHYLDGLHAVLATRRPNIVDVRVTSRLLEMHHMEYVELPVANAEGDRLWVLCGAFHFG